MSNINIIVDKLNSKNLIIDPSLVVLDTKNKIILSDINITLASTVHNDIQSSIVANVSILGLTALLTTLTDVNGVTLQDNEGKTLGTILL